MESLSREDVERLMFFDQTREAAEREHKANPKDALVLTKWGGALLELAHFRQGSDAYSMIEEAIEKFQKALGLDAGRHDALWCLGNAYTSQGFLSPDAAAANAFFAQANESFRKAVDAQPANESYKRALEMTAKAPALYLELQRQLAAAGHSTGGESASTSAGPGTAQKQVGGISDFWYDVAGWVTLVALGFGIATLSRGPTALPPAPAR
uniref:Mitochondrial import receptor subunit TOM20 n=1 Tax=Auxenochlorella protothecoides TaxID=3075 RepID=A0A1D1ZSB5_AUXPR